MLSTAFVFPGQGSQSIGMLKDLAELYPVVKRTFNEVSDRLQDNIWQIIQNGPEEKLNQTEYTQVAMLTADVAIYRILQEEIAIPASLMAGHSLGEYAALVCANALELADAAELVKRRGQLMQKTVPLGEGAMAAIIGLSDEDVRKLCKDVSTEKNQVTPANYNAIGQVVIAGHTPAVEDAIIKAEAFGARMAKMIPVSVPCHCPLLDDAAELFSECLSQTRFNTPAVPVISNVNLNQYHSAEDIRTLLKAQLCKPVRWVETIQLMKQKHVELVVECGPGKVLSGLIKRIDKTLQAVSVHDESSLKKFMELMRGTNTI